MGILEDIRKLDEYLANENNHDSDSESVHTDDLGLPTLEEPCSNEPSSLQDSGDAEAEVNDPYADTMQETLENCSDLSLCKAMILNRKKRQILCKMLIKLRTHLKKSNQYFMDKRHCKSMSSVYSRRFGLKMRLNAPYFKDKQNFPSPLNADAVAIADQSPQVKPKYMPWRRAEKTGLAVAVYTQICERRQAQIEYLIQNNATENQIDLLALKNIFGNKPVIEALARNWENETLENVEGMIIAKIKSDSNSSKVFYNPETSTTAIQSGFIVDSEPSTSGIKVTQSKSNTDSVPSTSGIKVNQSRFNFDSQPRTSGSKWNQSNTSGLNVSSEPSTSAFKWHRSALNVYSEPSTSGIKVNQSKLNTDPEPSTSGITVNKLTLNVDSQRSTSGIEVNQSKLNTDSEPSTSGITVNQSKLNTDSEPSTSGIKVTKSKLNTNSEPSTSGIKVNKSGLNLDLEPNTSSVTNNNSKQLLDKLGNKENSGLKYKMNENKYSKQSPCTLNIHDTNDEQRGRTADASNIEINSESNESNSTSKSIDYIDLDSYYNQRENGELIALQNKRILLRCISQWNKENINWYTICLEGRYEYYECAALWNVYLNPSFSKNTWTGVQDNILKQLAEENNFENWDLIAQHLNMNKSPYQCCVHFHAQLRDNLNSNTWTPEEDVTLKKIVELCRIGDHISWSKVAFYFQNRSRVQVYNRYRYALAPAKKGCFSNAENVLLLTLTNLYGKDMMRISKYFQDRSIQQLRNRLRTMVGEIREWTLEDDQAIILHVHEHGEKDWKLLSGLGQNEACVRHRFTYIKKWFEMNPNGKIDDMKRRNKNHYRVRLQTRAQIIDPLVEQLTLDAKNHANNRDILNITYIENALRKQPKLKLPDKVIKGRKPNKKITLDGLLVDYFRTTYEYPGTDITNEDNHLDETVERIRSIWKCLNVQLDIPSVEILEKHPKLDEYDVKVLSKLRQYPNRSNQTWRMQIPPSPETLIGYRGLWLLAPQLRSQALGKKMKGLYYAYDQPALFKKVRGYHFCNAKIHQYLESLPTKAKQNIIRERQIFWERFYLLFKWPCLLSNRPDIPGRTKTSKIQSVEERMTRQQQKSDAKLGKKRNTTKKTPESVKKPKKN